MKSNIAFWILLAVLSGCNITTGNPDNSTPNPNKLAFDGFEQEITFGEMVMYEKLPANQNYKFDVFLHTGSTQASYTPSWQYSGVGSYFSINFWSKDPELGSGTYQINGFVEKDLSITRALFALNVDWSTEESDFSSYLDGSVEVVNLGNATYEITINTTDYEGKPVQAYYKGELTLVE